MAAREKPCSAAAVPSCMAPLVADWIWARDTVGEAGAAVYRLRSETGAPDLYLKHGQGPVAGDVTDEMVRLRWLAAYLPVPAVRHFVSAPDEAWLLMDGLPGGTAYQMLETGGGASIAEALGHFLRRLHDIPVANCPFNSDYPLRLGLARARMDAELVDTEDFGEAHDGWTAQQVWDEITALLPLAPDPVVTHGDYSLDNLLIEDGVVTGCIDAGRVGIADRYQDIAIMWDCLGEFSAALQQRFLAGYGIERLDEAKLRFHLGLDEFF